MQKKVRISLLLAMDVAFAVIELVTGYAVHSLALVADSFHMFNDILSLVVALWAVHVSSNGPSPTFSYGMQRAEVLGALINAVFLLALCVTIFLEAIQRFIEPQEVTNPVLILVVGVLGLLSNFVGLVLFNEHGHSHGGGGGGGHSHGHGHGHGHSHGTDLEAGPNDHGHTHAPERDVDVNSTSSLLQNAQHSHSISSLLPENALAREEHRLLEQNHSYGSTYDSNGSGSSSNGSAAQDAGAHGRTQSGSGARPGLVAPHVEHHHSRPKPVQHGSASMNMEGVFLHVLGDALGNIGVIVTAVFIWKTTFWWRFYFDPIVSLFITAIIFGTAVPLCVRASKVLLQATPSFVNCNEVAEDIQSIPGIEEIHDLHIWQLSESQVIGTLHATISAKPSDFSALSRTIQECFAGHGVPSITIQPEFTTTRSAVRQCQSNGNFLGK